MPFLPTGSGQGAFQWCWKFGNRKEKNHHSFHFSSQKFINNVRLADFSIVEFAAESEFYLNLTLEALKNS